MSVVEVGEQIGELGLTSVPVDESIVLLAYGDRHEFALGNDSQRRLFAAISVNGQSYNPYKLY